MVIEQYTITNKYNFPQPTIDTALPQRFLRTKPLLTQTSPTPSLPTKPPKPPTTQLTEQYPSSIQLKPEPIQIKPDHQETLIAAVDTSTMKIGETTTGIIVAIRGAITWRQNHSYKYTRLGPFIFHITEDNKNTVYNTLEHAYFSTTYGSMHQSAPNLMQMPTRLASLLERWMQTMLAKTVKDGVILFDGSLTAGTIDTPTQRLREILSYARRNSSTVLAFSKATTLRANGILITEQLPNHEPPYLLETTGLHSKPPMMLLGDVYVARLNRANFAFRLDIDKETDCRAENWSRAETGRQRPLHAKLPRNPAALAYSCARLLLMRS